MNIYNRKITLEELSKSFGTNKKKFSKKFLTLFKKFNFKYRILNKNEENFTLTTIVKNILIDKVNINSQLRKKIWNKGWLENLNSFIKKKKIDLLLPKYLDNKKPKRYLGKFIFPQNKNFEYNYFQLLRQYIFDTYLYKYNHIHEFGCGTGLNVLSASKNFPNKNIYATDFANNSIKIVKLISNLYNKNIIAKLFDIKKPDYKYVFHKGSVVCTFGSIEQVGSNYKNFLNFIIKKKPELVINMEPIIDKYKLTNYMDLLSYIFIKKRGYSSNYLVYLKGLEKENKIRILKIQRTFFGGMMMDSYNFVIWKII